MRRLAVRWFVFDDGLLRLLLFDSHWRGIREAVLVSVVHTCLCWVHIVLTIGLDKGEEEVVRLGFECLMA